jgi:hypothetical protein
MSRTKKFVGALIILVLVIVAFSVYDYFNFSYVSVNPSMNQIANWTPFITFKFNKTLSYKGLSVKITPNVFYGKGYSLSGDELTLFLSVPMQVNEQYHISIGSITDSHGQTIRNLNFTFRPLSKNISQLPDAQQEALTGRNESSPVYKNPLLAHLPYNSLDFSLSATFPTGQNNLPYLVLVAELFVPSADTGSLQQQVISQYQQEVKAYISSFGLNPGNYKIDYVING